MANSISDFASTLFRASQSALWAKVARHLTEPDYMRYPRIAQFNLKIDASHPGPPGIQHQELWLALGSRIKEFDRFFGIGQTMCDNGMYLWDVEAVLERMESGKLTGTQLHWD